ncbi:MAG: DUF4395 domain-containing protein [Chloroflexota bacterium]
MNETLKPVDHAAIKVNQISVVALNLLAFVFNQPWLVALAAVVMLTGAALGKAYFGLLARILIRYKPEIIPDNPEPHRFAQGLGGLFMLGGTLALLAGFPALGWGLVWMVAGLAALNAFGGFCVGCFVYYWLTRLGAPGFSKNPPAGTFPGLKPREG